ncbi:MAG: hypothetical protein NXI22_17280, partial [bacterium]|nr:hypothetical protein [bacterium]
MYYLEVLNGLGQRPPEEALLDNLLEKLRQSEKLKLEVALFDRLPAGDPEKTHDKLLRTVEAFVAKGRELANRETARRRVRSCFSN